MAVEWHDVAEPEQVAEDFPLSAKVGERDIGVFLVNGNYYALEDVCPHAYALLSQGFVEGEEVECPLHGARFHVPSGRCTKEPGGRDLKTFPVKVEGGRLYVGTEN
jgi:nitrite reductase/ring-hydroxylating ferredoxin subunit